MKGFAVGEGQTSYVVVDSRLRKRYQASPGRQEWVTALECVSAVGEAIPPFIIFKGETFQSTWIPKDVIDTWKFSCSFKGWTSIIHGNEWVQKCFDPATKEKANGGYRLLICDGHDSHISANFVAFCMKNKIEVVLLLPHSSHLLQPLDVRVFSPLKRAMSGQLSRIFATDISRLQKAEWLDHYAHARSKAITPDNILGGWRGAGIFPRYPQRIIRQLTTMATPPHPNSTSSLLVSSSPPGYTTLVSANTAFNNALQQYSVPTPMRNHGRLLSGIAEQLQADNVILRHELEEARKVNKNRQERASGKHVVLKGQIVITTEEIRKKLAEVEKMAKRKKAKRQAAQRPEAIDEKDSDTEDPNDVSETDEHRILDCIEVKDM